MKTRKLFHLILTLFVIAIVSPRATPQETSASTEITITDSGNKSTHRWRNSSGFTDFNIEMRGKIEVTEDDKDIKSISDDGYLEINKTVFGSKRTIVIESLGDGKMKKEYYEGRTKMAWDANGKVWLSEILPDVVRSTTIAAESRVNRFYKQGGVAAVLTEIEKMESDHTQSHYANLLMKLPIQAKDYPLIISKISEHTDSDHYLSEFLKNNVSKFMQNKDATSALFAATKKIESDHYKTLIIKQALQQQSASLENVKIILQAAGEMNSDHYITDVLSTLLKQDNLSDAVIAEMIGITKTIESDHYRTTVLSKALDKNGLSNVSYQKVIESVKDIESDHYITEVIRHLLDNKLSDQLLTTLLTVTSSIESDHYRTEVLTTLLKRQDLTDEQFNKVMESCRDMESDHYKTVVLQNALAGNPTNKKVLIVLNAARDIDSDHYMTEVLLDTAPKVKAGNVAMKDAYRITAKEISSETYYGRVLRAIE
jgi:predicted XRE-type DNA-binding protein